MAKIRSQKLFLNVVDDRFSDRRQSSIVGSLTNGTNLLLNSYAKVFTEDELGSFDVVLTPEGKNNLQFFPLDGRINEYNYSFITYDIKQNVSQISNFTIGDIVSIGSSNNTIAAGGSGVIAQISTDYRSAKILVEVSSDNNFYEYTEITLVKDFNSDNVTISDFGKLTFDDNTTIAGLGTFNAFTSGSSINLEYYPDHAAIGDCKINTINIGIANTNFSQEGVVNLRSGSLESIKTEIPADPSPTATIVGSYSEDYQSSYIIAQITDLNTGDIEFAELFVINNNTDAFFVEYGNITSSGFLGSFSVNKSSNTEILYTPIENTDVEVVLFLNNITYIEFSNFPPELDLQNSAITSGNAIFGSADKTSFDLKYQGDFIFEKLFRGDLPTKVNLEKDSIRIPNHFFVTGEKVKYRSNNLFPENTSSSIGIALTTISGVGLTNKLSGDLYIYKVDDSNIKFASSAENALAQVPNLLDITSLGIGKTHYVTSTNQNQKCIITIDNVIQCPIKVSSSGTSILQNDLVNNTSEFELTFEDITDFSAGDFFRVDEEIMKITSLDSSTNIVQVIRGLYGTGISSHSSNTLIEKIEGNYNIVGSRIYFGSAPYGEDVSTINAFGSVITENTVKSSFHGRVFIRSGIPEGVEETYQNNYLFDDISNQFNAVDSDFTLKSNSSDILGIATDRSVVVINNVLQIPEDDFNLIQSPTGTDIRFTGTATSATYDPNNSSVPRGGIPISVGSTNGLGYQPLVSAGGTAIVSGLGTISSISIGSSGSGYRAGIQTNIRVGVKTDSKIEFIGTAVVSNGYIIGVTITNPGSGYLISDPPEVVIDSPLSYSNIPLVYTSLGPSGLGTEAKIDIVVGQGSSVIDFNIRNYGYSYSSGDVLTVETGGFTGIPLDPTVPFEEFSINIESVFKDNFSGWYIGELKLLDDISSEFDDTRKTFFLSDNGNIFSIISKKGSNIDVQSTILVVLNDVIQVPDLSYTLSGGSRLIFKEAPKKGDSCSILFYRGTNGIDVVDVDIENTIKKGDTLQIIGNSLNFVETKRLVEDIITPNSVETNLYSSSGISQNLELLRPVTWCRQREDIVIGGKNVGKDRPEYEPRINPVCNLIKSVGIGSTMIFVDSLESSFNYKNENPSTSNFIEQVEIIETADKITAKLSAVVNSLGNISDINIIDGGSGYLNPPSISIQNPPSGSSGIASATATITSGSVTDITITNSGSGYSQDSPPVLLVETPDFRKTYLKNITYSGDYGIITGVSTGSVGFAVTAILFDLLIPVDSPLRDSRYTLPTISESNIKENYYFRVSNSNIGNSVTSLDSNGNIIGIGTQYLDNVYQVASATQFTGFNVYGYEITSPANIIRVAVSVADYNSLTGIGSDKYFGDFSWGLITTNSAGIQTSFDVDIRNGVVGLNSSPSVKRFNPLKSNTYTVV